MDWVVGLRGQIIGLDSAPLIYYLETHPTYIARLDPFFDALDRGDIRAVTSTMTLVEVLVRPLRNADTALAQQYRDLLLSAPNLDTMPLSPPVAEEAARLRAAHNLRTPDAVQMATAIVAGATAFLTNDARLPRLAALEILVLDEL